MNNHCEAAPDTIKEETNPSVADRSPVKLFEYAMERDWNAVVDTYYKVKEARQVVLTKSGETAIHIAVADGPEDIVEKLVKCVSPEDLKMKNELGNTPLHQAAILGNVRMCKCIADKDPTLMGIPNKDDETPFFLAVLHGNKEAFLCLHSIISKSDNKEEADRYCRRKGDGDTILHAAITGEYFDLASEIISLYKNLTTSVNGKGMSPLHLLADKPTAFPSGSNISWFRMLIYNCIFVDELEFQSSDRSTVLEDLEYHPNASCYPETDHTCVGFICCLTNIFKRLVGISRPPPNNDVENQMEPQSATKLEKRCRIIITPRRQFFPDNYRTCFDALKLLPKIMIKIFGSTEVIRIRKQKEKHVWSLRILRNILQITATTCVYGHNGASTDDHLVKIGREMKDTPLLIAAKNGIIEIVRLILDQFPVAINDMNSDEKNIVLLAVEHRQPHIYKFLQTYKMKEAIFRKTDRDGNSALHLAAKLSDKPWRHGAALQMQLENMWYKFVKVSMPKHFFTRYNKKGETARHIFRDTHGDLVKLGNEWLTRTSESWSAVAVLIATVAFATSSTIPGGLKQDSGVPNQEHNPIFGAFAISYPIALCFSVLAIMMFMSIRTNAYQMNDYRTTLPIQLFLGMTSLFLSMAAMLVSFFAGHFFVLKENWRLAAFSLYPIAALPLGLFAVLQFPLYYTVACITFGLVPLRI